jgi:hypothetical protein
MFVALVALILLIISINADRKILAILVIDIKSFDGITDSEVSTMMICIKS